MTGPGDVEPETLDSADSSPDPKAAKAARKAEKKLAKEARRAARAAAKAARKAEAASGKAARKAEKARARAEAASDVDAKPVDVGGKGGGKGSKAGKAEAKARAKAEKAEAKGRAKAAKAEAKGRAKAEKAAAEAARESAADVAPDLLVTSPRVRAEETARGVAEVLGIEVTVDRRLAGPLDADVVASIVTDSGADRPCLVGHDPDFSEVLGELIGVSVVPMRKAAIARIDFPGDIRAGRGQLRFLVPPELLSCK